MPRETLKRTAPQPWGATLPRVVWFVLSVLNCRFARDMSQKTHKTTRCLKLVLLARPARELPKEASLDLAGRDLAREAPEEAALDPAKRDWAREAPEEAALSQAALRGFLCVWLLSWGPSVRLPA